MNSLFPALLPLIAFMIALIAKRGAIMSSAVGIMSVLLVSYSYSESYPIHWGNLLAQQLPVVLLLTLSVALVVFPGQVMNSLLKQRGVIHRIGQTIESIDISKLRLASLIVLGLAPALESLTGFGVSLFFTVPILIQLFPLRKALILSLLSMNIMPWGTLALASLTGAQITGLSFVALAHQTSLTSFFVFPTIGGMIYGFCKDHKSPQCVQLLYPIVTGLLLALFLVFYNKYATPELAGVYAGISVTLVGFIAERLFFNKTVFSAIQPSVKTIFCLFLPYFMLIAFIAISQFKPIHQYLNTAFVLQSGHIALSVFSSPGVFILLTVVMLLFFSRAYRGDTDFLREGLKKAVYPVVGVFMFIAFAEIQGASGILKALASQGSGLSLTDNVLVAPLIGMFSGYLTGSNVGGNVLLMSLQSDIGSHFNATLLFAAIQNSSAGHAVFLSIPMMLLTCSIAQMDSSKESLTHRNWLVRRSLFCAPFIYLALVAALALQTVL